jgi:uncharacterized phage-like protein YoqJ
MTDERSISCCFTGHRTIPRADKVSVTECLVRTVAKLYEEGYRRFIAGGALGFDTVSASAVIAFRRTHPDVRLVLVLPCADQDASWGEADRKTYAAQKAEADEVVCLADRYYDGCMRVRNQYMVDHASACIAYLTRPRSGAGQTVRMAKAASLRLFNTAPEK